MRYLHTMIRCSDLEKSLEFYCRTLGFIQLKRIDTEKFRLTYIVLAAAEDAANTQLNQIPTIELIHNWGETELSDGRNFGHLAFEVENLYEICQGLKGMGVEFLRTPHDGHKAFIRAPDSIVIELLQRGHPLTPSEPWISMKMPDEHTGN